MELTVPTNETSSETLTIEVVDSNDGLQQRYEAITQELLQIWGIEDKDDKVEIADGVLDWEFAGFLLQNEEYLNTLKSYIQKVKKKWLAKDAWDNLKKLEDFLNNIWNKEKLGKDYKKFFDKLQKPKDLHKMKEQEISRLNMYLATNENEAINAYKNMKALLDNHPGFYNTGMRLDDIRVFQNIWNELGKNYGGNETLIESEYPGYKDLTSSSVSLKSFLSSNWLEWNWDDITVNYIDNKINSLVNRDAIVAKFNQLNKLRTDNNRSLVENVNVNLPTADFTKTSEWVLKYKWNEFTANDVVLFADDIWKAIIGGDFVNDIEKWRLINDSRNIIYENIKTKMLSDPSVIQDGSATGPEQVSQWWETSVEQGSSDIEYTTDKTIVKIKDNAVKDKIKTLWFCDDLDGESIKFNIVKIRDYLEGIKGKTWKELQKQESSDRKVTIVAVQAALNYLSKINGNKKLDVKWVDWIRWKRTIKAIRAFQKENWLKSVDGKPWSETISKIVEVLWESSASSDVTNRQETLNQQETGKVFDYDNITTLDSNGVAKIFAARKEYDDKDWKLDTSDRVLKLNNISDINETDAESLSKWDWKIQVDNLLSIAVSEEKENIVLKLKKLAPMNGSLTIITSNEKYYTSLNTELNIKTVSSSEVIQEVSSWNGSNSRESNAQQMFVEGTGNNINNNVDNNVQIVVNWDNNWTVTGSSTNVNVTTKTS